MKIKEPKGGLAAMTNFNLIYEMICETKSCVIEEWEEETETRYGLIRFYSHKTRKSYQMLWENDIIIEFEEVS